MGLVLIRSSKVSANDYFSFAVLNYFVALGMLILVLEKAYISIAYDTDFSAPDKQNYTFYHY